MDLLTGIVLMVAFFVAAIVLIYLAVRSKRELERKRVDCTEAASGTVEKVRRISVSGRLNLSINEVNKLKEWFDDIDECIESFQELGR